MGLFLACIARRSHLTIDMDVVLCQIVITRSEYELGPILDKTKLLFVQL